MTIFAVHAPTNVGDQVAAADRCAFVRDSFSWGALFFGPLWLLMHQLWLALLGWLAAALLLWGGSYWLGLSGCAQLRSLVTILMVEHELAIMEEFCDPVIMMAEGAVLATGTMADLRARADVVEAYLVG